MKKSFVILIVAAMLLVMSMGVLAYAEGAGTENDPVVTKSYVDSLVAGLKTELQQSGSGEGFAAVKIDAGTSVICKAGTEVIIRSGYASAIDNETADGIPDLTSGTNVPGGKNFDRNHLLIIPKEDGRGIKCSDDCWIMIKGGYTLQ